MVSIDKGIPLAFFTATLYASGVAIIMDFSLSGGWIAHYLAKPFMRPYIPH
jgi:hypothetical protein